MTSLAVEQLVAHYGATRVLDDISFALDKGGRLCLLGPSGCGKTTTLQTIAGFITPDAGRVTVEGRDLLGLPPERRNIGVMFQNYALFPHMTVFDNVAFGLRMRGVAERDVRQRVGEALELVRLGHAAAKRPRMMSGGEQQRIAFARAVVIRPSLLLLDEPFSNLDARLRQAMRIELLGLLRMLRIATVMVTHDQEEAMAIADRIVLMRAGRIEQAGTPSDLYNQPASIFSAQFVGESNLLEADVASASNGRLALAIAGCPPIWVPPRDGFSPGQRAMLMVRPERIQVRPGAAGAMPDDGWNAVEAQIEDATFVGHRTEYRLRLGPHHLSAWSQGAAPLAPQQQATLAWRIDDAVLIDRGEAARG